MVPLFAKTMILKTHDKTEYTFIFYGVQEKNTFIIISLFQF